MMTSAARLNQPGCGDAGTQPLVLGYFEKSGIQAQITRLSAAEIRAAMAHTEEQQNLIVWIGSYSKYFNRLGPELPQTVFERTKYGG